MASIDSSPDQPIWVYMTTSHKRDARILARNLLEARLVACVNFMERWTSMYRWKDEVHEDRETVLFAKSKMAHFKKIEEHLKETSSYECPCLIAIPIIAGHQPYLNWLDEQTKTTN